MKKLNRWVYAIIGVVVLLFAGLVYAWSVMGKTIGASRPDWTAAQLSLTFTIVMAFFCIGVMLGGMLNKKVKTNVYVIASGILFLAGFFIAGLTGDSPVMLYIGYGVLGGLGSGFAYSAVMSTMSAWFPDKQGLISGILLMGFGISAFIVGKVFAAVAPPDGTETWKATLRILGIVICVLFFICSFFFVKPDADFVPPTTAKKKAGREPALEVNTAGMFKQPSFWLYYIWATLLSGAGLVVVSQASGIASQVGTEVSAGTIATVVGLISVMNGIGRVIFGGMYDKVGYKVTILLDLVLYAVATGILLLALSTKSFVLIVIGFIVAGLAYGGVTPTNSALISDFFGRKNFPMNFSIINTNLLIASFASTIAGSLYDKNHSYVAPLLMYGGLTVVGVLIWLILKRPTAEKK